MNQVTMNELSPMSMAELMLYAKITLSNGLFIVQSLVEYPTDWECVPKFPMLSDDLYMTVGELYRAIAGTIHSRLEYKNGCEVNGDMVSENLNALLGQASEMLRIKGDDLYICKLITPCGRYLLPVLFVSPELSPADMESIRKEVMQEPDEARRRDMVASMIANYLMPYHYKDKFNRDISNLAPGLALKILNTTEQIMLALQLN